MIGAELNRIVGQFLVGLLVLDISVTFVARGQELVQKQCHLDSFRLPRHIEPTHYQLYIKPNLDHFTFEGVVVISLLVSNRPSAPPKTSLDKIILHAEDLNIFEADFVDEAGETIGIREFCSDTANELIVFTLVQELEVGTKGELSIAFAGKIRDDRHGFYRSPYGVDHDDKFVAVTQFQAPHARKAFPCFDEPDFKATFEVIIEHQVHLKALSNMQPISELRVELADGTHATRVTFAKTPRMSTYLLAYAIGEFDHLETVASDGMPMAVWVAPGKAQQAEFWLKTVARAHAKVKEYFSSIDEPIKKIDFVCLEQLDALAMENWGLITVLNDLCFDDGKHEIDTLTRVKYYNTAAHELTHGWFGNLVTMRWWDNLWLNEGFAVFMSMVFNKQLYPSEDVELVFILRSLDAALIDDANEDKTHAIRNVHLETPYEIEATFDMITYMKSSAVLHMLMNYVGEEAFRKGIKSYLGKHLHGNTDASDLWNALEAASGLEVNKLMSTWIDQEGHPLVTVKLTQDGRHLQLTQERFKSSGGTKSNLGQLWIIPVSLLVSNGSRNDFVEITALMSERQALVELPSWFDVAQPNHWVKLNKNFWGFYRVHYQDERLLRALEAPIRRKWLSPADRLNIINDALALSAISKLESGQMVELVSWYEHEDNDAVISYMTRKFYKIAGPQSGANWSKLVNTLASYFKSTDKFNVVKSESLLRKDTRKLVLFLLDKLGNNQVRQAALSRVDAKGKGAPVASYLVATFKKIVRKFGSVEQKSSADMF